MSRGLGVRPASVAATLGIVVVVAFGGTSGAPRTARVEHDPLPFERGRRRLTRLRWRGHGRLGIAVPARAGGNHERRDTGRWVPRILEQARHGTTGISVQPGDHARPRDRPVVLDRRDFRPLERDSLVGDSPRQPHHQRWIAVHPCPCPMATHSSGNERHPDLLPRDDRTEPGVPRRRRPPGLVPCPRHHRDWRRHDKNESRDGPRHRLHRPVPRGPADRSTARTATATSDQSSIWQTLSDTRNCPMRTLGSEAARRNGHSRKADRLQKVEALIAWIGAHTRYSTDIPPLPAGADAVNEFLFGNRVGFCEQISTALTVMLEDSRNTLHAKRSATCQAPTTRSPTCTTSRQRMRTPGCRYGFRTTAGRASTRPRSSLSPTRARPRASPRCRCDPREGAVGPGRNPPRSPLRGSGSASALTGVVRPPGQRRLRANWNVWALTLGHLECRERRLQNSQQGWTRGAGIGPEH